MSMNHNLDGNIILENNIEISVASLVNALCSNPAALQQIARAIVAFNTYRARDTGNLYATVAQRKERPRAIQPNTQQRVY
jgi:hypothetical protein